jgi:curved DNA-binding protein CbpA
MVADPYKALGLASHDASATEIKRAYHERARKYHPDRYVRCDNEKERQQASAQFASCAASYELLTDPQRKAQYDHIYKYGGYDSHEEEEEGKENDAAAAAGQSPHGSTRPTSTGPAHSTGIGYTCYDPFAILYSRGQVKSRQTVAGIEIPCRSKGHGMMNFRFAMSSAKVVSTSNGARKCVRQTMHYDTQSGVKRTQTESVTYHPDGRKEVVLQEGVGGSDATTTTSTYNNSSTYSTPATTTAQNDLPWYVQAWKQLQEKLALCTNPCAAVGQ